MLNFLGVDSNFSVLAGQAWYCQFLFRDDTTGEPTNLDAVTFKGEISTPSLLPTKYAMEFTRSELDEQRNVVRVDIPALPEGRWRYTIMATDDGGNSRRLLYGFVTALGRIPDMNNGAYANRTLILRLPNDSGRKLQVEWAATTIAEFFARQSKQSAEEAAESAKQSEASAQRSETAAKQSEASAAAAKKSEEEALKSQQAARQSELNAATSAKQAAASATAADKSAQAADASAQLASSKADAASDSAARAKVSENAAKKSAEAAAASQNAAKQSELEAKSAAENAKARATDAKNSADAAAQSAQDAKDAADNTADAVREEFNALKEAAAQEAANAAQSAADSQSSADASADSAAASAQSAKDAAASATAAAGSATKAAGSASTAQSAAATAATDAANAAAKQTSDQLKAAVKADKDAAEAAAQRAEDAAANAAEVVGFDINDYTLKADFRAHADDTKIHPNDAKQAAWDNKLDEIDIKVRDGETKTFQPHMGAEAGDGVGRWIGIGQKDVQVTGDGDMWELVSVTIPCREAAYSGVGTEAYYLGVWEHVVGGVSGDFHRIATSENAVRQVLGQSGTWNFKKATIHHQDLRFAFIKEKDGVWPKNDWHLMGFRVAERTAESGNNTGAQSTSGTFDKTHVPILTVTYAELKDKFGELTEEEVTKVKSIISTPLIIGKGNTLTGDTPGTSQDDMSGAAVWLVEPFKYLDDYSATAGATPIVIGGQQVTLSLQDKQSYFPSAFVLGAGSHVNYPNDDNYYQNSFGIIGGNGMVNIPGYQGVFIAGAYCDFTILNHLSGLILTGGMGDNKVNTISGVGIFGCDSVVDIYDNRGVICQGGRLDEYGKLIIKGGNYGVVNAGSYLTVTSENFPFTNYGVFVLGEDAKFKSPNENDYAKPKNNGVIIQGVMDVSPFPPEQLGDNMGIIITGGANREQYRDKAKNLTNNDGIFICGCQIGVDGRSYEPFIHFGSKGTVFYGTIVDANGELIVDNGVFQKPAEVKVPEQILYKDSTKSILTTSDTYLSSSYSHLTCLGSGIQAESYGVFIGSSIKGRGSNCVLIGDEVTADIDYTSEEDIKKIHSNVVIGCQAVAISGNCVAVGTGARCGGNSDGRIFESDASISIGCSSLTIGNNSIAIGSGAETEFKDAIAIGEKAYAPEEGVAVIKVKKGTKNFAMYLFAPDVVQNINDPSNNGCIGFASWEDGATTATCKVFDIIYFLNNLSGSTDVVYDKKVSVKK